MFSTGAQKPQTTLPAPQLFRIVRGYWGVIGKLFDFRRGRWNGAFPQFARERVPGRSRLRLLLAAAFALAQFVPIPDDFRDETLLMLRAGLIDDRIRRADR